MSLEQDVNRDRKSIGAVGERIAAVFLEGKGFRIIERNYRQKWGEVDIVAEKLGVVHFVEVKIASTKRFSREKNYYPEELVDDRKKVKLARTATLYMDRKADDREYQIDVIGVILDMTTKKAWCRFTEQIR